MGGIRERVAAWLDEDDVGPMPMTEAEALRLLREAAKPYPRALRWALRWGVFGWGPNPSNWAARRFVRAWDQHAAIAERLGYCVQPGCGSVADWPFCDAHAPPAYQPPRRRAV